MTQSLPPSASGETPLTSGKLQRGAPKTWAAGLPAVQAAMSHVTREAGFLRGNQTLLRLNQKGGFDCPSCAWPDPADRSAFEYCENGAKAVAWETTTKRVGPEFFARHTIDELAGQSDHWLEAQGRLTHPMVRRPGARHYAPISWEEAFALIAQELRALGSPDEAIFYTSGRTSNEAAFAYQLLVRRFGTNNLLDCSNMCHESSGTALNESIGVGKGTVQLEDLYEAEVILLMGQNPGTNHPRMLSALARAAENGAQIVAVNPMREAGMLGFAHPQEVKGLLGHATPLASTYLQIRINGDQALLQGVAKALLELEAAKPGAVLDEVFLDAHTTGFEAYAAHLRALAWNELEAASGVSEKEIREVAGLLAPSRKTIACWAMGLTQHANAVATIQDVVNLLLLQGNLGRPGAGVCPVRGHSNVQGDRTMGIWEKPKPAFLDALEREFGFAPPRHHGVDTVEAIRAMDAGRAGVFFAMGGNFLSATPDTRRTARALRRCRLTAHVSTKLNRSHLVTGKAALILPCLGRSEEDHQASGPQMVSMENSMGIVHSSRGRLKPASPQLRSEVAIVCGLAEVLFGPEADIPWGAFQEDYDRLREAVGRVVPGFDDYNRRVREPGGFLLPNSARERDFSGIGGRAKFISHELAPIAVAADQLLLMTIRSHDQFNTSVYGLDDRYRGLRGERRVVFMNREDMAARGLAAEQPVDLTSHFSDGERHARMFLVVPYDLPRGCAAAYFPETNVLVPLDSTAARSGTPTSKSIVVTVAPASGAETVE
ncbi:MAG: FdhF/YdeP family oxidoreductase [Opitutales bacterium]